MSVLRILAVAALVLATPACKAGRPTEFVNVIFTVSYDTSHYRTWDFDLDASQDFAVSWVDADALRGHLLLATEDILEDQGYVRVPGGKDVDFLVSYEFWVSPDVEQGAGDFPARGSLVIRDGSSGALIWRATRKAPTSARSDGGGSAERVQAFAREMLEYLPKLHGAGAWLQGT